MPEQVIPVQQQVLYNIKDEIKCQEAYKKIENIIGLVLSNSNGDQSIEELLKPPLSKLSNDELSMAINTEEFNKLPKIYQNVIRGVRDQLFRAELSKIYSQLPY